MTNHDRIFRVGARHIGVSVWIYKHKRSMRKRFVASGLSRRTGNEAIDGLCWRQEGGDIGVMLTERGLTDGTAEHEAMHVVQFSGIKNHEMQAALLEEVCQWLKSLIQN